MIDVARIRYDLVAITPQGERVHLGDALRGLSWEEQPAELAVRVNLEGTPRPLPDGRWLHQLLPLGGKGLVYADWGTGWQEIVRWTAFRAGHDSSQPAFSRTAYDDLIYLTKSKDDRYYAEGSTAKAIITDICADWRIPLGVVEGPDVALARQVFRNRTLADMIFDVLEQARQRGAGRYVVRARAGKVDIIKPGGNSPVYHFGGDTNVQTVQDDADIDSLVTRVKVIGAGDKDARLPVTAQLDGRTEFGILQELVYEEQHDTPAAAREAAKTILADRGQPKRTRRVTGPDLPFLRRGDRVHIAAGTLDGYYLVDGISHDVANRTMSMEVSDVGE